jgi:hypothetical protein
MRYTKIALLAFGLGLLLGLVVVAVEIKWLERVASGLMALGIAAIPVGIIVDWRRTMKAVRPALGRRTGTPGRRAAAPARRPRKSPPRKR